MLRKAITSGVTLILAAIVAGSMYVAFFTNHVYVTTPSMYPTIPPGSLAFIHKEPRYHVGDVIEFHGNGLIFMHRIVKISTTGDITTKGDNPQNAPDVFTTPITAADVIGKVAHSWKWAGFPELILRHPGYGLQWLRAELGLRGKLAILLVCAILVIVADRSRARPRPEAWLGELAGH